MLLTKSCIYALRSSVYLARQDDDSYTTIKELSDELNISFHFLTKVLQQLTKQELLKSCQGPNGGVKLAIDASEITFLDIVHTVDGGHVLSECALGLPGCGELAPCPLHKHWSGLKTGLREMMGNVTIAELAARKNNHLLSNTTDSPKNAETFLTINKIKYT